MQILQPTAVFMALLAPSSSAAQAAGPFQQTDFTDALQRAAEQDKLVFVDFYATWCGPCKMLDRSTWRDETVIDWLTEHTIALKIDAEKQRDLARKYRVRAYPSLLFIKADGAELGRIVGYRNPQQFLAEGAKLIGKSTPKTNNPLQRQARAAELARAGEHAKALTEFLWCFDHGLEHNSQYLMVRNGYLLDQIAKLGAQHPPALAALRKRRTAAAAALADPNASWRTAADVAALDRVLEQPAATLVLHDQLKASGKLSDTSARVLRGAVLEELHQQRRYADVLSTSGDPMAEISRAVALFKQFKTRPNQSAAAIEVRRKHILSRAAMFYEALLGVERHTDATPFADKLIAFHTNADTFITLAQAAQRAGQAQLAQQLAHRAATELSAEEAARVREALTSPS